MFELGGGDDGVKIVVTVSALGLMMQLKRRIVDGRNVASWSDHVVIVNCLPGITLHPLVTRSQY